MRSRNFSLPTVALLVSSGASAWGGLVDPWADTVFNYSPGTLQPVSSGGTPALFDNPLLALGPVSPAASVTVASTDVVQLGQRGSITLGFDEPIVNNVPAPATSNPLGVDFTIFGNAFELGFAGSGQFFREPGFVEVAQKNPDGSPGAWFLLIPDKLPADIVANVDTGPGTQLLAYYADMNPVNGSGNPLSPPEATGSAGGDGFLLERAVVQSSPGVPLLVAGVPQSVVLHAIDFVRITDVLLGDVAGPIGLLTTEVDAVIDLPGTEVPEPGAIGAAIASAGLLRRRRR